jgi:outer membrane protein OmpA-like peptidoglycan-associated protein
MRPIHSAQPCVSATAPRFGQTFRSSVVICAAALASFVFFPLSNAAEAKSTLTTDCLHVDRVEKTEATIYFATGSTKLSAKDKAHLDKVADVGRYKMKVCVVGQADKQGDAASNQRLSEKRAEVIADYLGSRGVSRSRIETGSRGENFSGTRFFGDEKQAQERRVDVYFVSVAE